MIRWSASRINSANYCGMKHWLTYEDPAKPKGLRLAVYVKGSLLHNLIENFWKRNGNSLEEVTSGKKQFKEIKHFDAESFAKYAKGKWTSIIIADGAKEDKKIHWDYPDQKWVIKENISKICEPLYSFLEEEGPPLFAELDIRVFLEGREFFGRIDYVDKKGNAVIIRDWKSGYPWVGEMKLKHDPQLTFYNFLVCGLAKQNKEFAEILGLDKKRVEQYMGNLLYVDPNFEMQFGMIEALSINLDNLKIRTIPEMIQSTTRTNAHFFELINMVDGTQRSIDDGNIYPERGKKCDSCDMKVACDGRLEDVNSDVFLGKGGQYVMDFVKPAFLRKDDPDKESPSFAKSRLFDKKEDPPKRNKNQKRLALRVKKSHQ